MSAPLGTDDYREGALTRLEDARTLYEKRRWAGAIYLAGRAVEGILRSLLWLRSAEQTIGHDLRDLLKRTRSLGLLSDDEGSFQDDINEVAVVWYNNLRFVGDDRFLRDLRSVGRDKRLNDRRIKGDPLKANSWRMLEVCEAIVNRGDVVWKRYRTDSKGS